MKNFFSYIWYGSSATPPSQPAAPPTQLGVALDTGQIINESMESIDSLTMKRNQFISKAEKAFKDARALPKTDKTRRLALLKEHHAYLKRAEIYAGMIANMDQTAQSLDTAAMTVQLAQTMKAASLQMRDQLGKVQVEDIDTVVDELDDSMRDVNEMASALSRPMGQLGGADLVDDDELLAQMDEWDAAELDDLPDAPKQSVKPTKPIKPVETL